MDSITKFLKRLDGKELKIVHEITEQLLSGNTSGLNIKKLKGFNDIYRVRTGNIRIIYSHKDSDIKLIEISRRSE